MAMAGYPRLRVPASVSAARLYTHSWLLLISHAGAPAPHRLLLSSGVAKSLLASGVRHLYFYS